MQENFEGRRVAEIPRLSRFLICFTLWPPANTFACQFVCKKVLDKCLFWAYISFMDNFLELPRADFFDRHVRGFVPRRLFSVQDWNHNILNDSPESHKISSLIYKDAYADALDFYRSTPLPNRKIHYSLFKVGTQFFRRRAWHQMSEKLSQRP